MAGAITCKVEGLKEVENALLNLAPKKVRSIMRPALAAVGSWMAGRIATAAPRSPTDKPHPSGELQSTVTWQVRISGREDTAQVVVGYSDDQFYAWFVEFGHRIVRGGYSRVDRNGRTRGPGTDTGEKVPAHPFVRPTFDSAGAEWVELLGDQVRFNLGWED